MSFTPQRSLLTPQSNYARAKAFRRQPTNHDQTQYSKSNKLISSFIIVALSALTVGCNTLQALEPTAILISDIKNSL